MDVSRYLELRTAPQVVFDHLPERASRPRFMLPDGDDWRAVTWQAFADQIHDIALYLSTEMKSGERACIFAPNRVEWLSAALGIQAMGGVMVPIYGSSTAEQAAYVISHSDAKVVFVDTTVLLTRLIECWASLGEVQRIVLLDPALDANACADSLRAAGQDVPSASDIDRRVISWERASAVGRGRRREHPGALERLLDGISLDQNAIMLYTSGTSGQPKGVPLTHRNVGVNGRDWFECNAAQLDEGLVDLLWLPMSHIFGYGEAGIGNQLGWVSYLSDPKSVMEDLIRVRPHVFMSVPSVWEKLASLAGRGVGEATAEDRASQRRKLDEVTGGNLRFCLSGGAGLKREVKELFHQSGALIIEGYGLTECSPTLTLNRPEAFRFDTVGRPVPSVQIKLAEDGEILAKGPSVFAGYHKDPEATRNAFNAEGWLLTGDVGRFTEDGFLQIVDRKKDILVTAGGKNVAPANIELRFNDDPFLDHVVVYGDGEKYLVAAVWLNEEVAAAQLREEGVDGEGEAARRALVQRRIERVNAQLARYETIKKFVLVGEPLTVEGGLLTPTFKIRRKKIYERFGADLAALYEG